MLMIFTMSMKTWFKKNFHFPKIHIKKWEIKVQCLKTMWAVIPTDWMDIADHSVHKYDLQASKHALVWNYLTRHKYTIKWNDSSFWHIFTPITEIDIVHKVLKSEKKNHYITKNPVVWLETLWGMFQTNKGIRLWPWPWISPDLQRSLSLCLLILWLSLEVLCPWVVVGGAGFLNKLFPGGGEGGTRDEVLV